MKGEGPEGVSELVPVCLRGEGAVPMLSYAFVQFRGGAGWVGTLKSRWCECGGRWWYFLFFFVPCGWSCGSL
jgi:hypothetical protein